MLTPKDFEKIVKQAEKIYSQLELEIIKEIAERVANVGYANTVVLNDIKIAQEMGIMYQDIINIVAKYNEASVSQIQEIFDTAGAQTLKFDDKIYKEAGLTPLPLKQSPSMIQLLSATAKKTHNNLSNLVMTTATASQTEFYNAMNKAYMEVSTGVKSYSEAILDSIKEIGDKGTYITYPSGQHRSIESAVRMNVLTSVNQTCGKLQQMRAKELGWDLMEISAHGGARHEHAKWQGKIVSLSGQKGYLSLDDIGYGEPLGFKGINCRHDWMPYFKGSSRTYTEEQLEEWQNEKVTYNGKEMSKYDATQTQRAMERQIRNDKKEIAGLKGVLTSNNIDEELSEKLKKKIADKENILNKHNYKLNDFCEQTKMKKDYTRTKVAKTLKNNQDKENILNTKLDKSKWISRRDKLKIQNSKDMISNKYNIDIDISSMGEETENEISQRLLKLTNQYNTKLKKVSVLGGMPKGQLEAAVVEEYGTHMKLRKIVKNNLDTIEHEFAHTIAVNSTDKKIGVNIEFWKEIDGVKRAYIKEIKAIDKKLIVDESITAKEAKILKEKIFIAGTDEDMNNYCLTNLDEFLAVSFDFVKNNKTNSPYAKKVVEIVDKYFKKYD